MDKLGLTVEIPNGELFKKKAKELSYSLQDLSYKSGWSIATVSRTLNSSPKTPRKIKRAAILDIAKCLDIMHSDIFLSPNHITNLIPLNDISEQYLHDVEKDLVFCDIESPIDLITVGDKKNNNDCPISVYVTTLYDGNLAPMELNKGQAGFLKKLQKEYKNQRSWGAHYVASSIAGSLGLGGYFRVSIARCIQDYGRFPGISHKNSRISSCRSTPFWLADELSDSVAIERIIGEHSRISRKLENTILEKLGKVSESGIIFLTIHTYESYDENGDRRPDISLIYRPEAYQFKRAPEYVSPMFNPELFEFTADRVLAHRIALDLECNYYPVSVHFPYFLPDGSLEVRMQQWFYLKYIRQLHEIAKPEISGTENYIKFWDLINSNTRASESISFQSFLIHRTLPPQNSNFKEMEFIFNDVQEFLSRNREITQDYKYSPWRPSNLSIGIRSDLLINANDEAIKGNAIKIGSTIARSISNYIKDDQQRKSSNDPGIRQR